MPSNPVREASPRSAGAVPLDVIQLVADDGAALNALYGYLPGRYGLGEDLPHGVAAQWGRWCRHPDYFLSEHPEGRDRFARFDVPTRFYSASDDPLAPPDTVSAFLQHLPAERLDVVRLDPRDHGSQPIGHFGFFRDRFADSLWVEATDFLRKALVGDARPLGAARSLNEAPPRSAGAVSLHDDVMADLQFGRA